jgi:glutamate synthase (NADPH/NADH)
MLRNHVLCRRSVLQTQALKNSCRRFSVNTSFTKFPAHQNSLYDSKNEKDSCGVGLVAHLKKIPSRSIVLDANEMLVRMSHRGGCGCEPNAGDGAGMLVGMPHSYYKRVVKKTIGKDLGPLNSYGAGIIFMPKSDTDAAAIKDIFAVQASNAGLKIIGWRTIVTGTYCSSIHNIFRRT